MTGEDEREARFIELETRWSHQEDALAKLSDALVEQQARIDRLEALLAHWIETVSSADEGRPFDPANEKPPHY